MTYSFHPEAEIELVSAIEYYEECKRGLGLEFAKEVYSTIHNRIMQYPYAWQAIDKDNRRCLLNRFPFGIIYYIKDKNIVILAVMQLNKKPNYWKNRKDKYN